MKLEIKHLAAYYPYKLMMRFETDGFPDVELKNINPKTVDDAAKFKPILRQLSDLTKEIEHNGEKFVPIYRLAELFLYSDIIHIEQRKFEIRDNYILVTFGSADGTNSTIKIVQIKTALFRMEYWQLEKLFEWHFDVFGLIEQGLAIAI